jgi:hypothetical protein
MRAPNKPPKRALSGSADATVVVADARAAETRAVVR